MNKKHEPSSDVEDIRREEMSRGAPSDQSGGQKAAARNPARSEETPGSRD